MPGVGLEPTRRKSPADFKSASATSYDTRACLNYIETGAAPNKSRFARLYRVKICTLRRRPESHRRKRFCRPLRRLLRHGAIIPILFYFSSFFNSSKISSIRPAWPVSFSSKNLILGVGLILSRLFNFC